MVAEDDDADLCAVCVEVPIVLDIQTAHGWDRFGAFLFLSEAKVFVFRYDRVGVSVDETLFFFVVAVEPGFPVRVELVDGPEEVNGACVG